MLLFGLTNSLVIYQRYINEVLFDYLDDFCITYLNNILIYFNNVLEHKHYIKLVLQRLREAGLQVNIKKTKFYVIRIKYLSFIISI
jgi:hypothetical protein